MPRHGGGAALTALQVLLAERDIKSLPARAITSFTGYLRGRPDPVLEEALRTAFAEFDRELTAIMLAAGWHTPTGEQDHRSQRESVKPFGPNGSP